MTIAMKLAAAASAMNARLAGNDADFCGVSTDSRKIGAGELFVALRGENFDGHQFVTTAKAQGAAAAVVAVDAADSLAALGLPLLVVADTRLALGQLATAWRQRFAIPVIAVTGSNGKTTNKEMISSIMRSAFGADAVLATQGNLNNDIGVPLTLFGLADQHRVAIVEMGMNHPGEIAYLAKIAQPTVALVTNAQRAHLEGMGSLESIAREKGSVFTQLAAGGVAVFNADDVWADLWRTLSDGHRVRTFSLNGRGDVNGVCHVHGLETKVTISSADGQVTFTLAMPGLHNARNAAGAATVALAAGMTLDDVQRGLESFSGIKGRLQQRAGYNGAILLDDTYNANPDSVRAGIDVLAATVGKKILVLGDMGEIGEMAGQFHDEIGGYAKSQGIDQLFALGEHSELAARNFGLGGTHFAKYEELVAELRKAMDAETTVLIKGSRFMRMERVTEAVVAATGEQSPEGKK